MWRADRFLSVAFGPRRRMSWSSVSLTGMANKSEVLDETEAVSKTKKKYLHCLRTRDRYFYFVCAWTRSKN